MANYFLADCGVPRHDVVTAEHWPFPLNLPFRPAAGWPSVGSKEVVWERENWASTNVLI